MKRKSKSKQAAQPDKKPYVVGGCDTYELNVVAMCS